METEGVRLDQTGTDHRWHCDCNVGRIVFGVQGVPGSNEKQVASANCNVASTTERGRFGRRRNVIGGSIRNIAGAYKFGKQVIIPV